MMNGVKIPTALMLLPLLTGCWVLDAHLPPVLPPPNLPENALLCEVPPRFLEAVHNDLVAAYIAEKIADGHVPPERAELVLAHKVVVGMTKREVIGAFVSHPTRVRRQGPPGGETLLWEAGGIWIPNRWFVRLDDDGQAVAAGRY